jgi:hypothetical protein
MNPNLTKDEIAEAFQRTLAGGVPRGLDGQTRRREIFDGIYLLPEMEKRALEGFPVFHARPLTVSEMKALESAVGKAEKLASPGGLPGWDCVAVRGSREVNRQKLRGNLEGVRYRWRPSAPGAPGYFEVEYEVRVSGFRNSTTNSDRINIKPTTPAP